MRILRRPVSGLPGKHMPPASHLRTVICRTSLLIVLVGLRLQGLNGLSSAGQVSRTLGRRTMQIDPQALVDG